MSFNVNHEYLSIASERIVFIDGAMGTTLQKYNLGLDDFRGLENCSEILLETRPEVIKEVHAQFLEAGADAIETNTFGANRTVLRDFGIEDRAYDLNVLAVKLAREVAGDYSTREKPRFVIGSIGPGTKSPSLGHITYDELKTAYREQAEGLIDGGADVILIETCFDLLQVKSSISACDNAFSAAGKKLPLMVQVTIEKQGAMLLGSDIATAFAVIGSFDSVDVIGMNCGTGPEGMVDSLRRLGEISDRYISCLPNAGLPENVDGDVYFPLKPTEFAMYQKRFVEDFGVNYVGGCCGTTPEHIKAAYDMCSVLKPKSHTAKMPPGAASCYMPVPYFQKPGPLIVGEETNAIGSKRFRDMLVARDYDGMVNLGKSQVNNGAHMIDVCVAMVGEDETGHMKQLVGRMALQVKAPLMIDSTSPEVIGAALRLIPGKPVVNSINLEEGEERLDKVLPLVKEFGCGVVALTIDEDGMAKTTERKFEIARRIYDICTNKWGIPPHDLIFDALTFTLGSGDETLSSAAVETIEAIRRIKQELPGAQTILGVSNISFGLSKDIRPIVNSVFMSYALDAGLDMAIVNAKKIIPLNRIDSRDLEMTRRLVLNESETALVEFLDHFSGRKAGAGETGGTAEDKPPEERLRIMLIDGNKNGMEAVLEAALETLGPMQIINDHLLPAMKEVGELMSAGEMQLPFVLQSAGFMKAAVDYLEAKMEKKDRVSRGKIMLATVKGDVHDIGKNLVEIILRNNGYETINLGIRQTASDIAAAFELNRPDVIGLSGLLVRSALEMKYIVAHLAENGLAVPVICGGAALTRKYVENDIAPVHSAGVYYAGDAFESMKIMNGIMNSDGGQNEVEKAGGGGGEPYDVEPGSKEYSDIITFEHSIPEPPFYGAATVDIPDAGTVFDYLNEKVMYRKHFKVDGYGSGKHQERDAGIRSEVELLKRKALEEGWIAPTAVRGYFQCVKNGDSLIIYSAEDSEKIICELEFPRSAGTPGLCLSDYFIDGEDGGRDLVAFQAVTIGGKASVAEKRYYESGEYKQYLYLHGLSVMAAEATAEYVHSIIRREMGIAGGESGSAGDMLRLRYRGRRYSFGYGSCPDMSQQGKLINLLDAGDRIGLKLTENYMMEPEQSTVAIVVHHPRARYFTV
ncbi:MAG TPA: methionine synthase [bacterium]|nr:methionine synthase [bacterium]